MPIPVRVRPGDGDSSRSRVPKISSSRPHQRTSSIVTAQSVKQPTTAQDGADSMVPQQSTAFQNEQSSASLLRKPSLKTTASSTLRQPGVSTQISKPKPATKDSVKSDSPAAKSIAPPKQAVIKPQFSTYQRHFSPKKLTRPVSIASDTPSSNEDVTTAPDSLEVLRLRDELLQLRLLNDGSTQTLHEFEVDTKRKLKYKLDALTKQNESLCALERYRDRCTNYTALQDWLLEDDKLNSGKLQQLATCSRELDHLVATEGSYSRIVGKFQAWFDHMILAIDSRSDVADTTSQALLFIEPMDVSWIQELAITQRKIETAQNLLQNLKCAGNGGIHVIVDNYQKLAKNLSDELEIFLSIHDTALEQEELWVKSSLEKLASKDLFGSEQGEHADRGPVWEHSAPPNIPPASVTHRPC